LRERLHSGLKERLDDVCLNGHPTERLPGNLNLSFAGVHSDAVMVNLPEIAVSSGSACTSASVEPSYVLRAIGLDDDLARGAIRFGLSRFTTEEEIDFTIERVAAAVERLRRLNPMHELAGARQ